MDTTAMLKSHDSSDATSDLPFGLVPADDAKPVKRHRFAHNPAGTNFMTRLSARIYSYILEWVLFLLVIIIPLACIVVFIPFRDKAISLLDHTIQQPYIVHDTLPILSVFLPSLTVSLTFFAVYPVLLGRYARSQGLPAHTHAGRYFYWWTACLIQTIGVTVLLSELSKRLVQAPRPDFLHRCFPGGVPEHIRLAAVNNNYIVDTALCTPESRAIFEDGLQSVPSEHTSLTWCIMVNLVMFFMSIRKELLQVALINRTKIAAAQQERRARRLAHYASSTSLNSSTLRRRGSRSMVASETTPAYSSEPSTGGTATAPAAAPAIVAPPPPMAAAQAPRSLPNPIDTQDATFHAPTLIEYGASPPPSSPGSDPNTEPEHIARVAFWPVSDVVAIAHVVLPFGWAILVSFSRTFDHRHAFPDVMCGFVLGVTIAFAVCWMHRSHFESYHASWYEKQEEKRAVTGAVPLQPIASGGIDAKEYQPLAAESPTTTNTKTKTLDYPAVPQANTTATA